MNVDGTQRKVARTVKFGASGTDKVRVNNGRNEMDEDDYGYDEGSDIDNWEAEQVFQDQQAEGQEGWACDEAAEDDFRDAYEAAFSVRPVFSVDGFSVAELQDRTEQLRAAHAAGRFA
jgi:hypothetical protein